MGKRIQFPPLQRWQSDVLNDIMLLKSDIYVVKAKRQVGKSILAIVSMLYWAFKEKGSVGTIVEPTLAQSRRVFKQMISSVGGEGSAAIKSANASLLTIEFCNGSEILFKSAEQEEALRGMTVRRSMLVIDEAAFIKDSIFEILYPVVDANHCPILMISTPLFCSGEFYRKYTEGLVGGIVRSYDWSTYDTSVFLSSEKLDYYRQTVSPLKFKSEYLGQFIAEGSYAFGDVRGCVGEYSEKESVYCGIDWGTGVGDYTVATFLDIDGNITRIIPLVNMDSVEQINMISREINGIPSLRTVQVEMNSIGRVYYDSLKRNIRVPIREFNTTNDSKRRIIENLITAFQKKEITIPNDEELILELQHYNIEKTKNGYTYNGADGCHDDFVMSLAFAYDLVKKHSGTFSISFV